MQVLKGPESRIAIELIRTEDSVVIAHRDGDGPYITLTDHKLKWSEKSLADPTVSFECVFDRLWQPLLNRHGIAYPVDEAARKMIGGSHQPPKGFLAGSLIALSECLPPGDVHLFSSEGFIGRFELRSDAMMVSKALESEQIVMFDSAEDLLSLPLDQQQLVFRELNPDKKVPDKPLSKKHAKELFEMSKSSTKKNAPKKVAKAKSALKREDGPVGKCWKIFDRIGKKEGVGTVELLAACDAEGIKRGTSQTQLGRWRKKNNIKVTRGGPKKDATAKKEPAKPKTPAKKSAAPVKKKEKPAAAKKTRKKSTPKGTEDTPTSDSTTAPDAGVTQDPEHSASGSQDQGNGGIAPGEDLTPDPEETGAPVTMGEVADNTDHSPEPGSNG